MSATLTRPEIPGFEDVADFAIEHDLTDSLFVTHDILSDLFPMAKHIRLEHYVDPEDGHQSLFFAVCGAPLTTDQAVDLNFEWNRRVCRALSPEALFRIGMYRESDE